MFNSQRVILLRLITRNNLVNSYSLISPVHSYNPCLQLFSLPKFAELNTLIPPPEIRVGWKTCFPEGELPMPKYSGVSMSQEIKHFWRNRRQCGPSIMVNLLIQHDPNKHDHLGVVVHIYLSFNLFLFTSVCVICAWWHGSSIKIWRLDKGISSSM